MPPCRCLQTAGKWMICDLDASARVGEAIGSKTSTGYAPPELAKQRFGGFGGCSELQTARPSFDVWSFGVVFFELCSGRTLFNQDIANDELVQVEDKTKLCTWHTVSDETLADVFAATDKDERVTREKWAQVTERAQHLIRWCLKGDPAKRPTIEQVLAHPFFKDGQEHALEPAMPMLHRTFLSHTQMDASGVVGQALGCAKERGGGRAEGCPQKIYFNKHTL